MPVLPRVRTGLWTPGVRGFSKPAIVLAIHNSNTMKENSKAFVAGQRIVGRTLGWLLIWLAGAGLALWLKSSFAAVALAVASLWILFSAFTIYSRMSATPSILEISPCVFTKGNKK